MTNPNNPRTDRVSWLRWQISDELAESIAPGLREGGQAATDVLVGWLTTDRERLVSHCYGAMRAQARFAEIEGFTREEVAREIGMVAWCYGVRT